MDGRTTRVCDYYGEKNPNAKLTAEEVLDIRRRYKEGYTPIELADLFGISRPNIWNIISRRIWRHI